MPEIKNTIIERTNGHIEPNQSHNEAHIIFN